MKNKQLIYKYDKENSVLKTQAAITRFLWVDKKKIFLVFGFRYKSCIKCRACKTSVCMMTSSSVNIFRVTGHLCGEFTGHRWIPWKKSVTRSFDVFFDLRLNKWLSKQWCETPSHPLWRHCQWAMSTSNHHVDSEITVPVFLVSECIMSQHHLTEVPFWRNFRHWLHRKLSFW